MKIDFIEVVNRIFKDKHNYKNITDKDKEDNFFMVNRKFAVNFIKQSQFLNSKFIDKSTSTDIWNHFFKSTNGIPYWYWPPKIKAKTITNSKIPKKDIIKIQSYCDISDSDLLFLDKYYKEDLDYEIKKLNRFEE
jgi:hypothetical protein